MSDFPEELLKSVALGVFAGLVAEREETGVYLDDEASSDGATLVDGMVYLDRVAAKVLTALGFERRESVVFDAVSEHSQSMDVTNILWAMRQPEVWEAAPDGKKELAMQTLRDAGMVEVTWVATWKEPS